ncbi:MAG: hypothetical protein U0L49_00860 [Eubacterium sp.]|nr:hypothetical protein [Eubacterium sp.]
MDKAEYHAKLDELVGYVQAEDYKAAEKVADQIDWRRVKSIRTLDMVADVYDVNKQYEKERNVLKTAYSRASIGRTILYRLVEVCLKLNDLDGADKYFNQFQKVAGNDNSRYVLQYRLYKAKKAPLKAQISVLEEYSDHEYTERWAYELALLYSRAGDKEKCVSACDDLILWFDEGKYVIRAMELKMKYEPLSPSQQASYERQKAALASPAPLVGQAAARRAENEAARESVSDDTDSMGTLENLEAESRGGLSGSRAEKDEEILNEAKEAVADAAADVAEAAAEKERVKLPDRAVHEEEEGNARESQGGSFKERLAKGLHSMRDSFSNAMKSDDIPGLNLSKSEEIDVDEAITEEQEHIDSSAEADADAEEETVRTRARGSEPDEQDRDLIPGEEIPASEETKAEERKASSADDEYEEDYEEEASEEEAADSEPEEFDLDKFLAESAGNFSKELAEGGFEQPTEEAQFEGEFAADEETIAGLAKDLPVAGKAESAAGSEAVEAALKEAEARPEAVEAALNETVAEDTGAAAGETEPEETEKDSDGTAEAAGVMQETEQEEAEAEKNGKEAAAQKDAATEKTENAENTESTEDGKESENTAQAKETREELFRTNPNVLTIPVESEKTIDSKGAARTAGKPAPKYNPELEVPDEEEPSAEEKKGRTIPLGSVGANTTPIALDKILETETPEERRIRILNARSSRMSDDQRKIFTYFAKVPGVDNQILDALNCVYEHADEKTSANGNIAIMGAPGTGKTRLTHGLIVNMCRDMSMEAAKVARISGNEMNRKDPAKVVARMAGGFLTIEKVSNMNEETVKALNKAMEFRTDCMILIIEDGKPEMRAFLKKYPAFAAKFGKVISIPVFTNDELVTFARTYATENGCKLDDLGILALYTLIGNSQTEEEPVTIAKVKDMVDSAINHATKGRRRSRNHGKDKWVVLHEKDFEKR